MRGTIRVLGSGVLLLSLALSGCAEEEDDATGITAEQCENLDAQEGVGPETGVTCPKGLGEE